MKLEVIVVSKETITPSHPTPKNLHMYNLSFLDQISPPVYNPLILFYHTNNNGSNAQRSKLLKESLSKVLSLYYPLAGRISETNSFVICNDEGIPYVETEVNSQISDVLGQAQPEELNRLVPFQLYEAREVALLGVQLNRFQCGGIAIGLCVSHKVADASSTISFVKTWAAIARGEADAVLTPEFVSVELFPPRDDMSGYETKAGIVTGKVVAKRFVFKSDSIEALRARYAKSRGLESKKAPSRIETLSVFIWSRLVKATRSTESRTNKTLLLLLHAVNLRARMDPPLPEHSFGNYYRVAVTPPINNGDNDEECGNLISLMRDSIRKVDKEFVKSLQGGEGKDEHFNFIKQQSEAFMNGEAEFLNFTSLCRFPRYKADFGWGKPSWVGTPCLSFKNLVVFMDTAATDGIEALIHLDEADMVEFQLDEVLLQYASSC